MMMKLKSLSINPSKFLNNQELIQLRGGYSIGTCGIKALRVDGTYFIECNIHYDVVNEIYNNFGDTEKYWCCDSCNTSTYCGNA